MRSCLESHDLAPTDIPNSTSYVFPYYNSYYSNRKLHTPTLLWLVPLSNPLSWLTLPLLWPRPAGTS